MRILLGIKEIFLMAKHMGKSAMIKDQKGAFALAELAIGFGTAIVVLIVMLVVAGSTWQQSQTQIAAISDVNVNASVVSAGRNSFSAIASFASYWPIIAIVVVAAIALAYLSGFGGGMRRR